MAYRQFGARVAQSPLHQLRSPLIRSSIHRRFASTEPPKLVGPMDNAFNRERLAVKQHAAQSAGKTLPVRFHSKSSSRLTLGFLDLWRKLCI